MNARVVFVALSLLFVPVASRIPISAQGPSQTPTFRSGVKLIDLDVFVTDKDGRFVKDLTRDDFEIIEDNNPQEIRAFTFVDLPFNRPQSIVAVETPPPDVVTNKDPQGRIYVLLLDAPSTQMPPGFCADVYVLLVRRLAHSFIDQFLEPGDLVAVVQVQGTFTDAQSFTTNRSLLHASIDRYGMGGNAADSITRALQSYQTMSDLAQRLGAITGRRKTILWLGGQMRFSPGLYGIEGAGRFAPVLAAHRDAVAVATRNNVAVDAIDPCGLTTALGADEMDRRAGLQIVAEDTNGRWIVGTNNFRDGFTEIVRDNSTYYVLGYVPATEYRDGQFHEVKVRLKRPGRYTVRSRKGYTAPAPDTVTADTPAPPAGASPAAREALRLPVHVRGLGVSLFSAPFKGSDREQSVVIGGQISGELLLDGRRDIGLSYQVFTQENHVQVGEYKIFALDLKSDSRTNVAAHGLHFVDRLSLPPGRYEIRYAVDQPDGAVGSVVAPLIVPKFDEELALSGVVLASVATTDHFMLRDDAGIRERLGANPTSARVFRRDDTVNAFLEVYSDDMRLTADDLTVTGTLSTIDGKAVSREEARLRSAERPGDGRWAYTVGLALADVPAGAYVLTVDATSTRHKEPVRRAIPITVED